MSVCIVLHSKQSWWGWWMMEQEAKLWRSCSATYMQPQEHNIMVIGPGTNIFFVPLNTTACKHARTHTHAWTHAQPLFPSGLINNGPMDGRFLILFLFIYLFIHSFIHSFIYRHQDHSFLPYQPAPSYFIHKNRGLWQFWAAISPSY